MRCYESYYGLSHITMSQEGDCVLVQAGYISERKIAVPVEAKFGL